jgi:hypothetical protein
MLSPYRLLYLVEHDRRALIHQGGGIAFLNDHPPAAHDDVANAFANAFADALVADAPRRRAYRYVVPFAHPQAVKRHPSANLRSATVKIEPDCVTCLPCTLNVMVVGTTTYALSPVTSTCYGLPRVTT